MSANKPVPDSVGLNGALKREKVSFFESGKFSVMQPEKFYGVSDSAVYR